MQFDQEWFTKNLYVNVLPLHRYLFNHSITEIQCYLKIQQKPVPVITLLAYTFSKSFASRFRFR